jgi:hypothetical protein
VAAASKTLDEAWEREQPASLAWEKKKTIARHLEQQLTATQGIAIPQGDDDDHSVDAGSNLNAALTVHLHVQAADLQNIRSVVIIVLEPSSPNYRQWCNLMLPTLRRYALDNHILFNVADQSVYWARVDIIMMTWILGTHSPELHENIQEPTETACQAWLTIEAQFLSSSKSRVLQLDTMFRAFKQGDLSVNDYCRWMKGLVDDLRALGETVTSFLTFYRAWTRGSIT